MRVVFTAVLASVAILDVSAAPSLLMKLVTPESVTDVDSFSITAIVTNTGTETLKLLNDPRSVLSSEEAYTFTIVNEKGSPEFTGMFFKYSPNYVVKNNNPADFTILAPGQAYELTHNLAGVYNFTNTGAGEFKVDAMNVFQYVDASGELATIEATTESKKVSITGKLVSTRNLLRVEPRTLSKRVAYVGCTAARQQQIAAAVRSAVAYVSESTAYLNRIRSGTPRYTTWFGAYNAGRLQIVRSHFTLIGVDPLSTTYDCTCTRNVFASVNAGRAGYMYLCNYFWPAPNTGTDSKAGTIVHEQSHFRINGGTEDIVYGQGRAKNLARTNPAQAIMNADNHEYFAENTPRLA